MTPTSAVHELAEYVVRTTVDLPTPARIRMLENACEVLPEGNDSRKVGALVAQIKAADRACREFSFIDHSDQI